MPFSPNHGGLGGLGGFSPSFPQRFGAPISNVVENLPFATQEDWLADWQRRYNEEAAKAQPREVAVGDQTSWRGGSFAPSAATISEGPSLGGGQGPTVNRHFALAGSGNAALGGGPAVNTYVPMEAAYTPPTFDTVSGTPDFTAFEAERAKMMPLYQAQVGNQQAYDSMLGMNQMNGLPGPDYANANFGQVTGQQNQPITAQQGVDMSWASGVYDPSYASGMFGSTGKSRNDNWL